MVTETEEEVQKGCALLRQIINGTRKKEITDWWLSHIDKRADSFLEEHGYKHDILPADYLNNPPSDLATVEQNLSLLEKCVDGFDGLDEFLLQVMDEVYVMLDALLSDMKYVLYRSWMKIGLDNLLKIEETEIEAHLATLQKDYEYLLETKKIDQQIEHDLLSEGQSSRNKERMKITAVVPVAGLIMARFHIYACECRTVVELWKAPASTTESNGEKGKIDLVSRLSRDLSNERLSDITEQTFQVSVSRTRNPLTREFVSQIDLKGTIKLGKGQTNVLEYLDPNFGISSTEDKATPKENQERPPSLPTRSPSHPTPLASPSLSSTPPMPPKRGRSNSSSRFFVSRPISPPSPSHPRPSQSPSPKKTNW
eukprot:CAMPEP_0201479702 /NCGR_PEP_ID=MMETSP0151_2-20130828/4354_1 /ASSEMBLY_ACC=CAM_ASM_000257 /TAXON_ID=200890 /ORGANISM="Paramoeba atlantica, Strain 621/1 / CCAP 1560/9" /LENGTH=367 /DNA_ID=CAMNT_0047861311 /DNA_START=501 /DNA_END=1601 /DNA_ORIENTATION=+